jgi:hypothetical protein
MCAYLQNRELFVFDGFAGADPTYRISVRVVNELASQNMFMHQLLLRPTEEELAITRRISPLFPPPDSSAFRSWTASIPKPPSSSPLRGSS